MSIFDFDDGDIIISGGNIGFDSDGDMMMRMGDNMAMDMDTGELHITSGWDDDRFDDRDDDRDNGWENDWNNGWDDDDD